MFGPLKCEFISPAAASIRIDYSVRLLGRRHEFPILDRHDDAFIARTAIAIEVERATAEDDGKILDLEKAVAHRVACGIGAGASERSRRNLHRRVAKRRAVIGRAVVLFAVGFDETLVLLTGRPAK